jgi:hypothetical protein
VIVKNQGKPVAPPPKSSILMANEIQMVLPDSGDCFLKALSDPGKNSGYENSRPFNLTA